MYPIPGATIAATTEYYDDATTERGRKINAQDKYIRSILSCFYVRTLVHTVPKNIFHSFLPLCSVNQILQELYRWNKLFVLNVCITRLARVCGLGF